MEVREVGRFEHRWDRIAGPISAWIRNRKNWRRRRRIRTQTATLTSLARDLDDFDLDQLDPDTRRMAILVDGLGFSRVLDLGFGMAEALIVATEREPMRLRPLIASACEYDDDELCGTQRSGRAVAAVRARNEMINAARDVVARTPKTDPPDIAPAQTAPESAHRGTDVRYEQRGKARLTLAQPTEGVTYRWQMLKLPSPAGIEAPDDVLPAWNWLPPGGLTPRLDRCPRWVRVWYRTPLVDRWAHEWMWHHGGWDVTVSSSSEPPPPAGVREPRRPLPPAGVREPRRPLPPSSDSSRSRPIESLEN